MNHTAQSSKAPAGMGGFRDPDSSAEGRRRGSSLAWDHVAVPMFKGQAANEDTGSSFGQ